jgi:outer membrane protein
VPLGRLWLMRLGCCAFLPGMGNATTLGDVLLQTYRSNPTLSSQRLQLRALNEEYVQAKSGARPQITLQASGAAEDIQSLSIFRTRQDIRNDPARLTLNLVQPLYTSGRVTATIDAAEADILAAREALRASEAAVLLSAIQAYSDVLRDMRIVALRSEELVVLRQQLSDAQARRKAGEVTVTDVLQSQSQLQSAQSQMTLARGQLEESRAAFLAIAGGPAENLETPQTLPGLPATIEDAFGSAEADNPDVQHARFVERASKARIAEAKANEGPTIALQGTYGYSGFVSPFYPRNYLHNYSLGLTLNQSLGAGGANASSVRQARATAAANRLSIEVVLRQTRQRVAQSWSQVFALQKSAEEDRAQALTAEAYFKDTAIEYKIGQRSTLDVLIAEQTYRGAEIASAQAEHDAYVASASLLASMGRLNASAMFEALPDDQVQADFMKVRKSGSVPWEGVVQALDGIGAHHPLDDLQPTPPIDPTDLNPVLKPAKALQPGNAGPITPKEAIAPSINGSPY